MKSKIIDIYNFYNEYPEYIGEILVNTQFGFKEIEYADITAFDSEVYVLQCDNSYELKCSPNHRVFSKYGWKHAKDLVIGEAILTDKGYALVNNISLLDYTDDLYDLQVAEVNEYYTNGIVSHNSSMLESISYALFGKSLKKVVLSELINSINKKKLVTEIEFTTNGHEYKIIRGEKPKVLEFYKDNELLNQEAASKDTQAQIEYVLGFDHKTFCQMIVINKVRYIPFMDQSPAVRRKVIEDILDISVISVANDIAKERNKEFTKQLSTIEYERAKLLERKVGVQRLIEQQEQHKEKLKQDTEAKINELKSELEEHTSKIESLKQTKQVLLDSISIDPTKVKKKQTELTKYQAVFESKITNSNKLRSFFDANSNCPTCKQSISDDHKDHMISSCDSEINTNESMVNEVKLELSKIKDQLDEYVRVESEITQINNSINKEMSLAEQVAKSISNTKKLLEAKEETTDYESELIIVDNSIKNLESDYMEIYDTQEKLKKVLESLKDTGVKATIVSEYIDFINQKINEYLRAMEFWCVVTLDENFNENIRLGQREKVSYDSFSTGQQTRLNIAIFLALTEVASIKNSVSTNLIMLDEILENVDAQGVDNLLKLFNNVLNNKNIFVVTQRADEFRDFFRSEIAFVQDDNDFTKIV